MNRCTKFGCQHLVQSKQMATLTALSAAKVALMEAIADQPLINPCSYRESYLWLLINVPYNLIKLPITTGNFLGN